MLEWLYANTDVHKQAELARKTGLNEINTEDPPVLRLKGLFSSKTAATYCILNDFKSPTPWESR